MNIDEAVEQLKESKARMSKKHSLKQDNRFQEIYSQAWFDKIKDGGYEAVEMEFSRRVEKEKS